MVTPHLVRISTRGSQLALWQAEHVAERLGLPTELRIVKSKGDQLKDVPLQGRADQGFFTKEIQAAVLSGDADLAVHSLKDLPTAPTPGLALAAVPLREVVEDVLLVHPEWHDPRRGVPVRPGGIIGATSLRRQALLRHFAPDLEPRMLRGNVPTRLTRLREGEFAAILLARAGVRRLALSVEGFHAFALDPHRWIPAPGQAALGVEALADSELRSLVASRLQHAPSRQAVDLERALLSRFEAGCHAPFGALALFDGPGVTVQVGCGTEAGGWAAASVAAPSPESALDAAWEALVLARDRNTAPGAAAHEPSPCAPIEAF